MVIFNGLVSAKPLKCKTKTPVVVPPVSISAPVVAPSPKKPVVVPQSTYEAPKPKSSPKSEPAPAPAPPKGYCSFYVSPEDMACYVNMHNNARRALNLGLKDLVWGDHLAKSAFKYSNELYGNSPHKLSLRHSQGGDVGENLYAQSHEATCEAGMQAWIDEKPLYTPGQAVGSGDFSGYGHYTQIVDRDATSVGCAVDCYGGKYLTCHYDKIQTSGKSAY